MKLHNMRKEFGNQLDYQLELPENPFDAFKMWFNEAQKFYKEEANCFVLSSSNQSGIVSSRVVLMKGFSEKSLTFFTNYDSQKAKEIEENPNVSILFYWSALEKQIRIQAKANKTDLETSQRYFSSRPRNSQLSAWTSKQSSRISGKKELIKSFNTHKENFKELKTIPCPENWGGYSLEPTSFEFWLGGLYRLHDRVQYDYKREANLWTQKRLSP